MENEGLVVSPRSSDAEFTRYWDLYVEDVVARKNYKKGHLQQLIILCQLYTEFDKLTEIIKEKGYSYSVTSRNGEQEKVTIEVTIRDKVMMEIRMYSKILGLILQADNVTNTKEILDEWD